MENTYMKRDRGKLICSSETYSRFHNKSTIILSAICISIGALLLLLSGNESFREVVCSQYKNTGLQITVVGLVFVLVATCALFVTLYSQQTHINVYEHGIDGLGRVIGSKRLFETRYVDFSLNYVDISRVEIKKNDIVIYSNSGNFTICIPRCTRIFESEINSRLY